jgi:uncharacterized membrane protein
MARERQQGGEMASQVPSDGTTSLGVAPNVGGLLCYLPICCIGLVFSVVAAIVEKENRFLRFHAFQGLLFQAALFVVWIGGWVMAGILGQIHAILALLGWGLMSLLGLGGLALCVLLMVKAYNNEEYELPVIGGMARNWV